MKPNPDITPLSALETIILETIAEGATYGYEIAKAIERASGGQLLAQEGTLYPALHRLEKRGLLEAEWSTSPEGRPRKHYRLTALGRKERLAMRKEWTAFTRTVNLILGIQHAEAALAW
jgi:PadR family transcriptional regulator, regulatory protein PadR